MQKTIHLWIAAVLTAGTVLAQDTSDNIGDIFNELMANTQETAPAARQTDTNESDASFPQFDSRKPDSEETPANSTGAAVTQQQTAPKTSDVDAMVEESRKLMVGGDYQKALQGLAEIIKIAPENVMARMYLRTLLERDHETAEIDSMKKVADAWATDMVLRSYRLAEGAAERMKLPETAGSADVATLFPKVEFPKGSSAIYQPKYNSLFVRNTPENLSVMDVMLDTMGVLKASIAKTKQVEIEAKFIEVAEGTLEELGFQWNFDNSTTLGVGGADLNVDDGTGLFADALRGSTASSELPFGRTTGLGDGTASASGDWSSFRIADTFSTTPSELSLKYNGGTAFDMMISALDQSTGTDVLSAPRIVTRSGEEATLRVGELHYYPEVYEGDSSQSTIVNVSYADFQEKLLGVELTVIPRVEEDNTIMMQLNPRITELAGWQSYQLAAADTIYTYRQVTQEARFNHPAITASLPIFKKREIETAVTILDGGTIGMGGLINEKMEAYEDKVPVLGSIPLLGRLFRNEGERAVKRNLLMFVTAKIVEPNGRVNTSRSFE
jgi:type II secretory pathway component GspD/PulD (secretin)